jgi:hypothetical protein
LRFCTVATLNGGMLTPHPDKHNKADQTRTLWP